MNSIIRSRLCCIVVVLTISIILIGCPNTEQCLESCMILCIPFYSIVCIYPCGAWCLPPKILQCRAENPDECAATFEQMQLAAIQFCEESPEVCQQAFESYVQSFEEEASK